MIKKYIVTWLFLLVLMLGGGVYWGSREASIKRCVPTFADGDGPYYRADSPNRYRIVPDKNGGKRLVVSGKLLRNDCKSVVPDTIIDIWQADETGNYQNDWYRGRVVTDKNGRYKFETVIPLGYGEGTGYRPPHIHFKIWENGKLLITSEMFFPESKGKHGIQDDFIMELDQVGLFRSGNFRGYHDIVLP